MQPMLNMALRAARSAGDYIATAFDERDNLIIKSKDVNDFVTEVDKTSEKKIIQSLSKAYPNHGYYGEESGYKAGTAEGSDYTWIIDPLDGTTNFIHGMPHFAISIACLYKGRVEHAVVLDPIRREEFTASRGHGAALNGRRIRVTRRPNLDGALIGTGFPFRQSQLGHVENYFNMVRTVIGPTAGIRRAGAASLDLAYVAAGRFDAFWEFGLSQWDMAAGSLLVTEAGGLVSDFQGGHSFLEAGQIICGNPKCFKAMLKNIQPFVNEGMKH